MPRWRHQMETLSVLLNLCAGNSRVTGEFPSPRPGTRSFDVFFDLRLNKRLSKHSWGWWFETPSRWLWRHCNVSYHHCQKLSYIWHEFKQLVSSIYECLVNSTSNLNLSQKWQHLVTPNCGSSVNQIVYDSRVHCSQLRKFPTGAMVHAYPQYRRAVYGIMYWKLYFSVERWLSKR